MTVKNAFYAVLTAGLIFMVSVPMTAIAADDGNVQLSNVLRYAYENNPKLRAARAELRAVQESMPQALGGWKPTIDATGSISSVKIDGSNFGGEGTTSKEVELGFNQPIYRGGRTLAATDDAEAKIYAQRQLLEGASQDLMLEVATAYMNVVRDESLLNLSENNTAFLRQELEATEDRFEVGELTKTDVYQAEARLAAADSDRISAGGDLEASRAAYEAVVGLKPGNLMQPNLDFKFPNSLEASVSTAEENNPYVIAAEYIHESAENQVDEVFGELLPELAMFGTWNRQFDPQPGLLKESTTRTIGISATIPLYQAGKVRSRVREAKHTANQRFLEIMNSRRNVRREVTENWESLEAARAEITSRESQVQASRIALEGVKAENELGARSVLDVLDAEQEYLDARAALITARRNEVVAQFALASTLGILSPDSFGGTDFSQQFEQHLDAIKWKILGIDVDSEVSTP